MRWPFMTKARYDADMARTRAILHDAINREYARATRDGKQIVHGWARDAAYNVLSTPNPRSAAQAAFQEAEHLFRPAQLNIPEVLNAAPGS